MGITIARGEKRQTVSARLPLWAVAALCAEAEAEAATQTEVIIQLIAVGAKSRMAEREIQKACGHDWRLKAMIDALRQREWRVGKRKEDAHQAVVQSERWIRKARHA
jgi:hypothetical protein